MMIMRVSGVAVMLAGVLAGISGTSVDAADAVSVREAVRRATLDRMGTAVLDVEVGEVSSAFESHPALVAVPDPAGLVGRAARFALTVNGVRRGTAVASVRVRARVARMVRPVPRGQRIEADDVAVAAGEVDNVRFVRLPEPEDVVNARARRDLAPGVLVTRAHITVPPAVQNGDRVTVGVTVGRIHATTEGVASGSGEVGDLVHIVQPGRRGRLRARVMDRGVVEVVQ